MLTNPRYAATAVLTSTMIGGDWVREGSGVPVGQSSMTGVEEVVLLADDGTVIGRTAKDRVHGADTPLHLAFSCYLFDAHGNVLVTRRALDKRTWPGVWTNSFCGHPSPGEDMDEAVLRRGGQELGVAMRELRCVLPDFRYRAVDSSGTVENEVCPVYCAVTDDDVLPDPDEVAEYRWVSWPELRSAASVGWTISPWASRQIPLLEAAGLPR